MKPSSHLYLVFAVLGLATALFYALPFWASPEASFSKFSELAFANAPAATLSADVTVLYLLANFWIVFEGRQLKMKRLWVYVLANTLVAVAFGLPLFLWFRERALTRGVRVPAVPS